MQKDENITIKKGGFMNNGKNMNAARALAIGVVTALIRAGIAGMGAARGL